MTTPPEPRSLDSFIAELRHVAVMLRSVKDFSPYTISVYADRLDVIARELKDALV